MEKAILFALAASLCTATSSVCQRLGARTAQNQAAKLDVWLVFRLARHPIWLTGIASMILGFVFQLAALHYGPLALVQPILALELLFVFGYMAILGNRMVKRRDWLAAAAMCAGLAVFLFAASPSGGRQHAPGYLWLLAGLVTLGVVLVGLALAASQPGFTILDPLSASLLGLFLFGEHFQTATEDLALEALALALLVAGVSALSHSHLIQGEQDTDVEPAVAIQGATAVAGQSGQQLTGTQSGDGSCRSTS
jgi:drug/metabolite transporter (DMT)-like permease